MSAPPVKAATEATAPLGQHCCPNGPCQILPRHTRLVHASLRKTLPFVAAGHRTQARRGPRARHARNGVARLACLADRQNTDTPKRKAPREVRGAVVLSSGWALGRFGLDDLGLGFAVADRDLARLLGFRNLAYEIDVQQAVLEAGVLDLDMVGQLEDALKGAGGDALIEYLAVLLFLGLLGALDRQRVLFRLDRQLVLAEAGNGNGYAVVVLTGALDVVRRVARRGFEAIKHRKQAVKADGGTVKGCKIERSHGISSIVERHAVVRRMARPNRAQP